MDSSTTDECSHLLLKKMLQLYVRVRMHSFAKDIKEKHKVKFDENKKRSLRTTLKKKEEQK